MDGLVIDEDTATYYIKGNDNGYMILDSECNVVESSYKDTIDDFEICEEKEKIVNI